MKKITFKKSSLILRLLLLALLNSVFLTGCSSLGFFATNNNVYSVNLYYSNNSKNDTEIERRRITVDDTSELPLSAMKELLKPPSNKELISLIPSSTSILGFSVENTIATVDFSSEFAQIESPNSIIARQCVVNTLCNLDNITKVNILVDGAELLDTNRDPIGSLGPDNSVSLAKPIEENYATVKLYFADEDGQYLVPEERRIKVKESMETDIIAELIKGPERKDLVRTLPKDVKIKSCETTNGISAVNFSQEFISSHGGGTAAEELTIYSVVNTLTEIKSVNKVQFLIEGSKTDLFIHMEIKEPFDRDENYINPEYLKETN